MVPSLVEARGRHGGVVAAGLYFSGYRLVLGDRGSAARIYRGIASPGPVGPDAGRARHADVVGQQTTRKLRQRDGFRDLPDVLLLIRALFSVASGGCETYALL